MAVSLHKTSYYAIQLRTRDPRATRQPVRRTRFHSAAAASKAAQARIDAGHTLEYIGYVTGTK